MVLITLVDSLTKPYKTASKTNTIAKQNSAAKMISVIFIHTSYIVNSLKSAVLLIM